VSTDVGQHQNYESRRSQSYAGSIPDFASIATAYGIKGLDAFDVVTLKQALITFKNHAPYKLI
jgi:thiamine pyrophosphate-dependent acetolactate synthase large subunit-like protein